VQRESEAHVFSDLSVLMKISAEYLRRMNERYKHVDVVIQSNPDMVNWVKASYTGKWNIEILPNAQPKQGK